MADPSLQPQLRVAAARGWLRPNGKPQYLCRYFTGPALVNERVQCNAKGQVVLRLNIAWREGTLHLVMSPLKFMQRAILPAPERAARTSDCFKAINSEQRLSLQGRPAPVAHAISPPDS